MFLLDLDRYTACFQCVLLSFSFVFSLYVWLFLPDVFNNNKKIENNENISDSPKKIRETEPNSKYKKFIKNRHTKSEVKKRLISVTVVTILSMIYTHVLLSYYLNYSYIDFNINYFELAYKTFFCLSLVMILFIGPILMELFDIFTRKNRKNQIDAIKESNLQYKDPSFFSLNGFKVLLNGIYQEWIWGQRATLRLALLGDPYAKDKEFLGEDLKFWRAIIFAPITEEIVFRSLIIHFLFFSNPPFGETYIIFLSPMLFGLAHLHHIIQIVLFETDGNIKKAILTSVVQLGYTTVFGWISSFLYLRSGSVFPPIAAHMFCNSMGFPRFDEINDYHISVKILFVLGLISFFILLFPLTSI